jgi:hypothetical protein
MFKIGIVLLAVCAGLCIAVVTLDYNGIYIFAGDWGKGFGTFCYGFIETLFIAGIGSTIFGYISRRMRKVR